MNHEPSNRHHRARRINRSIDGISASPRQNWQGSINFRRTSSYTPGVQQSQMVGDFKQSEGFHPASQDFLGFARPAEDEAQEDKKPKKRFWSRLKAKRAAKKAARQKISKKQRILRIAAAFGILIMLTGGFLAIKAWIKAHKIFQGGGGALALNENVDPSLLKGEGDGRINILMLGKGGEGHTAPDLTDTILIASIDPINNEAAIVSLPRDLYVKTDKGTMKINSAYATAKQSVLAQGRATNTLKAEAEKAGFEAIEKAVTEVLGIPIHYHSMVDFNGFKKAVDSVGGVDFDVPSSVYEQMRIDGKSYTLNVKAGRQHFDGFRALAYVRCRHCSARGDFDRNERQRLVLIALKDKILSVGTYANPIRISQLLDAFGDHVQSNLSIDEMLRLNEIAKRIGSDKFQSVGLADPPNNFLTTANVSGQSVVVPRAGVGNYSAIQSYIRNTLKDGYLKKEDAGILVLNGTTRTALANTKAEELKSYGYRVIGTGDAPTKNYQNITIVDLTGGAKKYTKRYLEQRFRMLAITKLPDGIDAQGADFVIIVGKE